VDTSPNVLQKGIWIASYPKSGNTWVRVFIANLLRELQGKAAAQGINLLNRTSTWEIDAEPYQQLLGKPLNQCTIEEIARIRPQVQRLLSAARSRPFFIKTHLSVARFEGFPTINFDITLAAIYIVRNPLDVAISYAHHAGREIDHIIEQMADPALKSSGSERHVYEFMGSWSFHVASWSSVSHRPVYVMRYEDMLASPYKVFGGLAGFLRLAPTPDQLKRAIDNSSFAQLSKQEFESGFREKPEVADKFFRVGRANQWREVLTKEQASRVVKAHAPMMMRGGYLLPHCGADILGPSRPKGPTVHGVSASKERNRLPAPKESANTISSDTIVAARPEQPEGTAPERSSFPL
jgi:hypothetical protein